MKKDSSAILPDGSSFEFWEKKPYGNGSFM